MYFKIQLSLHIVLHLKNIDFKTVIITLDILIVAHLLTVFKAFSKVEIISISLSKKGKMKHSVITWFVPGHAVRKEE